MLILHHLNISQSERIVWLFEELQVPYKLVQHIRSPLLSPETLTSVPGNSTGKAPFLEDTDAGITMSESGAICEYVANRYGGGKLTVPASDKNYSDYLRYLHFANGTLQAEMVLSMFLGLSDASSDSPIVQQAKDRLETALDTLDRRLSKAQWLAGDFSIADIMILYTTTTQRYWGPQLDLGAYKNILRWMKDCGDRPAYQSAMAKGDPDMRRLLTAEPPSSIIEAGGTPSTVWRA